VPHAPPPSPGEITLRLGAVLSNLGYMPAHLIYVMPMLVLGLAPIIPFCVHGTKRPMTFTGLAWLGWGRLARYQSKTA
jgi:hypothetical protein